MTRHGRSDKAASFRRLRVGEELRHALAEVLGQGILRHPALDKVSITVSEVRVGPDLRNATAFVMPLGGDRVDEVIEALKHSAPYLRTQVARRVNLRYMPTLDFEADVSFDHASRVDRLLREAAGEPEPGAEPGAAEPGAAEEDRSNGS